MLPHKVLRLFSVYGNDYLLKRIKEKGDMDGMKSGGNLQF
jgi:hypothetical protein